MAISMVVAGVHVFANIFFIHTLGFGFLGAAYAICLASLNNTLLTAGYVIVAGMQDRVWGQPTWDAFKVQSPNPSISHPHCMTWQGGDFLLSMSVWLVSARLSCSLCGRGCNLLQEFLLFISDPFMDMMCCPKEA